jgi:septum formation protein
MSTPRVILASASPRRRELLALVGIPHVVEPADIDESYRDGEEAAEHAERLAREKVATIVARNSDAIVIAADTIVLIDGLVLGKPRDAEDAERMLAMLAGQTHVVLTAVAVAQGARMRSGVESVRVTFRPLTRARIRAYIATREPMDKAGSYGIQGYGATLVERIDGDYFAVMGLALARMIDLLGELGVSYTFGPLSLREPA